MSSGFLKIKSKRQFVRLWFECYQICLKDKKYKDNLKKSKKYYSNWGNVEGLDFDKWYKEKGNIFEDLKVKEIDEIIDDPNIINITIPLNEPIHKSLKEVKRLVESKRTKDFNFKFDKNFKGVFRYINLEIYKIWVEENKPPINLKFLRLLRTNFDNRPKSKIKTNIMLPTLKMLTEHYNTNKDVDSEIRSIRRGIREVERTIENVSKGKFP